MVGLPGLVTLSKPRTRARVWLIRGSLGSVAWLKVAQRGSERCALLRGQLRRLYCGKR